MNIYTRNQRAPDLVSSPLSSVLRRWLMVLIGFAMLCLSVTSGRGAEALKEYELKAAFVYNFSKFIEWPTNRLHGASTPFVVAVAGTSPCAAELGKIAKERKVNGRTIIVKTVQTPAEARDAQVLFVAASEDSRLKEWLAGIHGAGVLSIGESERFSKEGGMINFLLEGEKIRFDLNIDQAEDTGLKISAQLQKLARTIRRNRK